MDALMGYDWRSMDMVFHEIFVLALPALGFVLLIALFVDLLLRLSRNYKFNRFRTQIEEIASRVKGTVSQPRGFLSFAIARIEGSIENQRVRIKVTEDRSVLTVEVEIAVLGSRDCRFGIAPRSLFVWQLGNFDRRIKTGDERFDSRTSVKTNQPDTVLKMLDPEIRSQLLGADYFWIKYKNGVLRCYTISFRSIQSYAQTLKVLGKLAMHLNLRS